MSLLDLQMVAIINEINETILHNKTILELTHCIWWVLTFWPSPPKKSEFEMPIQFVNPISMLSKQEKDQVLKYYLLGV